MTVRIGTYRRKNVQIVDDLNTGLVTVWYSDDFGSCCNAWIKSNCKFASENSPQAASPVMNILVQLVNEDGYPTGKLPETFKDFKAARDAAGMHGGFYNIINLDTGLLMATDGERPSLDGFVRSRETA